MKTSIGKINLTKGRVVITDPSHDKGTWCTTTLNNVFKGEWEAFINTVDDNISSLTLVAVGQTASTFGRDGVGVDSGLCGIFEDKPDYDNDAWDNVYNECGSNDYGFATKDNAFHCAGVWSTGSYGGEGYIAIIGYNDSLEVVYIAIYYLDLFDLGSALGLETYDEYLETYATGNTEPVLSEKEFTRMRSLFAE